MSHNATHTMPSGLGGAFDVRIIGEVNETHVRVRVTMRNPDFDGNEFTVSRDRLTALNSEHDQEGETA